MKHSLNTTTSLLSVETMTTRDYAATFITPMEIIQINEDGTVLCAYSNTVIATGTSRKHPDDKLETVIGRNLSIGRALRNLGNRHIKRGNGLVKHADDMRIAKATQKAKPSNSKRTRIGVAAQTQTK